MVVLHERDIEWFAAWHAAGRSPVFFSDDPPVWRVIEAVWERERVRFQYWGGSTPGTMRTVSPTSVFTVDGFGGIYAEGMCHDRGAIRVFRLDRVNWPDPRDTP